MKSSELIGTALDWAVGKANGWITYPTDSVEEGQWYHTNPAIAPRGYEHNRIYVPKYTPSTSWALAGPIIKQEGISVIRVDDCGTDAEGFATTKRIPVWAAVRGRHSGQDHQTYAYVYGPTPLIAAMRYYVASKLGDEVDIPKELL